MVTDNSKVNISRKEGEYTITATDVYPSSEEVKEALTRIDFIFSEVKKAS